VKGSSERRRRPRGHGQTSVPNQKHGDFRRRIGIYSRYARLSRIDVTRGEIVKNGQIVRLVGATGRVTAPHLHWAMSVQGARVDPFSLSADRQLARTSWTW
jgi:murein DD-endopeptidase MepM/ murein hydrolase activator NlpD